jgi:hypothetical protein
VKKELAEHDYNALDKVLLRVFARGPARAKRGGDVDDVFWYTKHVHYTSLCRKASTEESITMIKNLIFPRFGTLRILISDGGTHFTAKNFKK